MENPNRAAPRLVLNDISERTICSLPAFRALDMVVTLGGKNLLERIKKMCKNSQLMRLSMEAWALVCAKSLCVLLNS